MADFISLDLQHVYDSSDCDLIDELIVPLLSKSKTYYRGVGYFSSGWIRIASIGIADLIKNEGYAKIIMSPILDHKDWETIKIGYEAKDDEWLKNKLLISLDEVQNSLENETLNTFAWLIADGIIELRFAVPRDNYKGGDYHDKVAVFTDGYDNTVAIHGSYNDSVKGTLNGEAFSVFRSWDSGQKPFVIRHSNRLKDLWEGKNSQFSSLHIPDAIKDKIIKLRTSEKRPYNFKKNLIEATKKPDLPNWMNLYDYQEEAIHAWKNRGYSGLFEMATGSGKTYTSLAAYIKLYKCTKKLGLVILVPYLHLLFQWEKDCKKFGLNPILCGSSITNWKISLKTSISNFRLSKDNICIIAVHQTAGSESFIKNINRIPKSNLMLIADEAHGLGSKSISNALIEHYSYRIGLSATPRRWYDELGTKILKDYFNDVCFSFSLKDAIDNKFLVPYKYYPILVNLTPDEEYEIDNITTKITKLLNRKRNDSLSQKDEKYLEQILRERANIVKKASNKLSELQNLLIKLKQNTRYLPASIFYSPDSQYSEVLDILKKNQIFASQFIGEDSYLRRQAIIEEFEQGKINALVAMKCLDEGVDIPSTEAAYFLSSTTNPKEFIQRRGRVLRKSNKKKEAILYDFIVVPSQESSQKVAKYILEREMPRFAEFSELALNSFDSRSKIRPILDFHEKLDLIDKKPWDVYKEQQLKFNEYKEEFNG